MKIQCDVCDRDVASVFCAADEAALCAACDRRVHRANKLAGKHHRFSLHCPSPKQGPVCDICQERKAFLFCQEDRAILCRECDGAIHRTNEHTRKHARFLLAGVKLSSNSALYSASPSSPESSGCAAQKSGSDNGPISAVLPRCTPSTAKGTTGEIKSTACENSNVESMNAGNHYSESRISEYLMEMLPGWRFEEFLDSSSSSSSSSPFLKNGENELLPLWDGELEGNTDYTMSGYFPTGRMGIWVPQMDQAQNQGVLGEQLKEFAVPQIIPFPSVSNRRRIL